MPIIDSLAGDRARKRRTVAEHMQLAHGLAGMADDILSDLHATTHELTLCSALSGAAQAHAALASAMMLEQQARQWELQAHPLHESGNGQPAPDDGDVAASEPLRVDGPAQPNGSRPVEQAAAPALVAPPKPERGRRPARGRSVTPNSDAVLSARRASS